MTGDGFGSCFKQAYQALQLEPGAILVHAIITNPSGRKIAHAWLEERTGAMVYDASVSQTFTKQFFYEGYKPILISKYDLEMAQELAQESDLYGPWEPVLVIFMEKMMKVTTRNETEHSRRWKRELIKTATKGK